MKALQESNDGIEALLILNSLVLLRDGPHGYQFRMDGVTLNTPVLEEPQVQRRLEYLGYTDQ